jgi:GH25 family lysozyme M1 (1,4-beta-N-acetylmuramidase)
MNGRNLLVGLTRRIDGIDVYQNNGVNWPAVADFNVTFGIAKAWHETDFQDTQFRNFWPAMRDAGLIRGAFVLLAPNLNKTRAQIETMMQHFTDRIDAVGGLQPGDLPPLVDFEVTNVPGATGLQSSLNQLAWALNAVTPYTQRVTGRADLLPMVYTGKNTWINTLGDPTAANMSAFVTTDGLQIDFTQYPLWWAWLANNSLDPLKATDLATIRYPISWPGPRPFYLQYSGGVPFPNQPSGQPNHDASIICTVDNANVISVSTDFSPMLKLASVAPLTADVSLSRVQELSDQPPDQVFSLLLIGQGFWPDEFNDVINQGLFGQFTAFSPGGEAQATYHAREGVADIPPLNLLFNANGKNGIACYYDAGTHIDGTGLALPLRQEATRLVDPLIADPTRNKVDYDTLRIDHQAMDPLQVRPAGRTLAEYLTHLTVTLPSGKVLRATDIWPVGQRRTGAAGSLVAVLRKAPTLTQYNNVPDLPSRIAEYYKLDPDSDDTVPFIAVNVIPQGDWPLVLARAIAQNLAGLGDEFELEGANFAQPPDGSLSQLAPNILNITDAQRTDLVANKPPDTVVPEALTTWGMPKGVADFVEHTAATANFIPPWNSGAGAYPIGGFHLIEGGDGFRTHTLRCDRDCLMRRIPAAIANGIVAAPASPPAFPIQSTLAQFCEACKTRLRKVIQARSQVKVEPRVEIDSQRRMFDSIGWNDRKTMPPATVALPTTVATTQPTWSCSAEFAAPAGFQFTDIRLFNVDYWAPGAPHRIANVLQSVSFNNLSVTFKDGTNIPLSIATALAATKPPPTFEAAVAGDTSGRYQVGACLTLSWQVTGPGGNTATIDAELSLVLASMDNDVDPCGAMVGCRLYPQLAMRLRRAKAPKSVKSLQGTITLQANNADPSNLVGTLKTIANGKLVTSVFSEGNRALVDGRKRAKQRIPDAPGSAFAQPLPYWSWIYDYCQTSISAPVRFTGVFAAAEAPQGSTVRDFQKAWPPAPAGNQMGIHKLPRQGAYDSLIIHPDRGNDAAGHPIIGGPINADLGLHLSWRRGVSWSGGQVAFNTFRGWGPGRLDQGARALLGAPTIPPNQHLDVNITPAANPSTVTVDYIVTATGLSTQRWHVFLEQGLAFAFQYAVELRDLNSWGLALVGWLAGAVGAGDAADIDLDLFSLVGDADGFDAKVREIWLSIFKRQRSFDPTVDASSDQQIPDGPSDTANLENL